MRLDKNAFALTAALIWGFGVFFLTWWIFAVQGQSQTENLITQIYPGYRITPTGSLIGLAWGLVDGFIGGWIFAWLYNSIIQHKVFAQVKR